MKAQKWKTAGCIILLAALSACSPPGSGQPRQKTSAQQPLQSVSRQDASQ
ncbi:hypothetical protein [Neisseria arctica]|nr:hypothetical protein [Neisseria arctica]UOO85781.1 hypothetical protein LVJ86_05935 [Neisseria arctica]